MFPEIREYGQSADASPADIRFSVAIKQVIMTEQRPERRARTVALVGLVFQIALGIFFTLLWVWSESEAVRGLCLLAWIGVPIWLLLLLIYHQRVLVQDETLESEHLRKQQELTGGAIFDVDNEELLLARRRLRMMYKWLLPAFTIVIILALALAGHLGFPWSWSLELGTDEWPTIERGDLTVLLILLLIPAFLSFLLSRSVVGLARYPEWRLLRCGASYLMGITLASAILMAALLAMYLTGKPWPEPLTAKILRGLLLVLAAEVLLNFVLDFYRPRSPDEEPRPAFDSRLLGLFTEPGGIARSIADAINYQFGFEVSSTWFYQLLQRSFGPLVGFSIITLFVASCFVFVDADENVVIERFGVPKDDVLQPGAHLKWPWPIDKAYPVTVGRIHELRLGDTPVKDPTIDESKEPLYLWTNRHSKEPHLSVLIATPKLTRYLTAPEPDATATQPGDEEANGDAVDAPEAGQLVPVSQLRVAVRIQYRILDAYQWINTYADPEETLEALADREVMRYCASVDVKGLLGPDHGRVEQALWETIRAKAEKADLGVDIVFLGVVGIHPPETTAEAFQEVAGAVQKRAATISSAEADYKKKLSEVAGSQTVGENLAKAISKLKDLKADPQTSEADLAKAREEQNKWFFGDMELDTSGVGGEAVGILAKARARRWHHENEAHAQHVTFIEEMKVKNAAPGIYRVRKYLEALAESVGGIRKYVLATNNTEVTGTYVDLRQSLSMPLSVDLEKEE